MKPSVQVLPCLEEKDGVQMLHIFLLLLLAVYLARDCPLLSRQPTTSKDLATRVDCINKNGGRLAGLLPARF